MFVVNILGSDCIHLVICKIVVVHFFPNIKQNTTEIPNLIDMGLIPKIMRKKPLN